MTTHRGSKPPDQEQQRKKVEHRRRHLDRAGAGPTLKQVMRAGRARPRAAAHEAHEKPPSERPAVSSLSLEFEGQESRVDTVDLPEPSPLGLQLEAREGRVGTHPDLRLLDLVVEENASPASIERTLPVTQVAPEAAAARPPVQAKSAAAPASPAAPTNAPLAPTPVAAGHTPAPLAPAAGPASALPALADGAAGAPMEVGCRFPSQP